MSRFQRVKNAIKFTNPDRIPLWAPDSYGGGLIGVSYSGSTVNMLNVQAMIDIFRSYGIYK